MKGVLNMGLGQVFNWNFFQILVLISLKLTNWRLVPVWETDKVFGIVYQIKFTDVFKEVDSV